MTAPHSTAAPARPPVPFDQLRDRLRAVVGAAHVLTDPRATRRYSRGYRFGQGRVEAVVRPGSLVEQWRAFQACVEAGRIVIMQAANTGLTGGSTPTETTTTGRWW